MSFLSKLFGHKDEPSDDDPFMEHPTGQFKTACEAMAAAFRRLQTRGRADRWIAFNAQGRAHDGDSYQIEEVRVCGNSFDLRDQTLDLPAILKFADLARLTIEEDAQGMLVLIKASPDEMARFLDAVFRQHFGIRPHKGEDDYAVGAEWC